jgi:predicted Zn finger-like uncharacterized protein
MIVECPHCSATFEIARALLEPAGRKVQCSHCTHIWLAKPTADGEKMPLAPAPVPATPVHSGPAWIENFPYVPDSSGPASCAPGGVLPVLVGFLALIALAMTLIGQRQIIVHYVPRTAPLFAAVGLKVDPTGIEVRNLRSAVVEDGGRRTLTVEGDIANLRQGPNNVPRMRLALRDATGSEIYSWMAAPAKARLDRGEIVSFRARLSAPPVEAKDVVVRFAPLLTASR